MTLAALLARPFGSIPEMVSFAASQRPEHPALILNDRTLSYRELDRQVARVACSLQREGLGHGSVVAACASTSFEYVALFLGALRVGAVMTPLPPSATAQNLTGMLSNSGATMLFQDRACAASWSTDTQVNAGLKRIWIDGRVGADAWGEWLDTATSPIPVQIQPDWPFNLIYSSGTTGTPKGIVQPCSMRWSHVQRAATNGYGPDSVTIASTPLYSNTTLVALMPTLALGGTVVLMSKFDTRQYLELAEKHRVTHTMLVPVQYQRLMDDPEFDRFDLSSFQAKFSTSAPFSATLKAEVLKRWPGRLTEIYGMTEGGGRCELEAHNYPNKLHTIGRPASGHDIRLIDEQGQEVPKGQTGEIVGSSSAMMEGYYGMPEKTREVEWFDPTGKRFIRTGDIARMDEDGFLILADRKKDMVISGGFNIYPSDLEAELGQHPAVKESAVVGVASRLWGETPVGYVVLKHNAIVSREELLSWVNARLGKTQRLADLILTDNLPRNEIGKVLKRELRDRYVSQT
ncbi:class I adenylate-forming enzyme family protein [Zwartia sp.]|uniref:class I adenylate-forming enzyme family protein n=1 Tax=Zwartia sp. TaxID=2978004 RepID=UPI002724AAD3|nr:class I adenylate-forming enzyme family protein [Zwartia sp.]MDO9025072.1 class I adenylate-forming enzyme family protein [Zwartia sp.]